MSRGSSRARDRRLRSGCARVALLAAAGIVLGCGSGADPSGASADTGELFVDAPAAAPAPPAEPVADPVEAFVALAREAGEDERTIAIARCTMEQVQEYNGSGIAQILLRAKKAELAKQPIPPEAMPALGILLQEAQDCAEKHDGTQGPGNATDPQDEKGVENG